MGVFNFALSLWAVSVGASAAFPLLGAKHRSPWAAMPYYRSPRPPYNPYYDPYGQDLGEVLDFYYPPDPYDKYRLYQVPYYYPEPLPYGYYGPEEGDAVDDPVEEPTRDDPEAPYGQETWYDSGPRRQVDPNAEANAVFLQNLILAQMYKDTAARGYRYPLVYAYPYPRDDYDDGYVYGEPVADPTEAAAYKEDEDVKELKSLAEPRRQHRTRHEDIFADQKPERRRSTESGAKRSEGPTGAPQGQQEVVLPRPAPPPRRPSIRQPSVYDSIKKLLHMQDQIQQHETSGRGIQKRSYVPSEESLVEQLGNLKKS